VRAADAQNNPPDPHYDVVPNWPQPLHPGTDLDWSRTGAIFAESPNKIFILQTGELPKSFRASPATAPNRNADWPNRPFREALRCGTVEKGNPNMMPIAGQMREPYTCPPGAAIYDAVATKPIEGARWEHVLFIVDGQGKLIESWEQWNHLFTHPHGITIDPNDPEKHVWVVDDESEQVFKFTHDGKKLVMTLGEFRVRGDDNAHFGGPTGLAFGANGDIYVSDGYKNFRVVKFDKTGKFLTAWGKKGTGPGEFVTPHTVEVGPDGRVYVGDRGNGRIQIFDANGKYLSEVKDVRVQAMAVSKDKKFLYVVHGPNAGNSQVRKYDLDGKLILAWGRPFGREPGQVWGIHDFSVDSDGNLYLALAMGGRAWKYQAKKGVPVPIGPLAKTPEN
jgi:peptidylamidoglycolate lyase